MSSSKPYPSVSIRDISSLNDIDRRMAPGLISVCDLLPDAWNVAVRFSVLIRVVDGQDEICYI